jgi:hypothetical protein
LSKPGKPCHIRRLLVQPPSPIRRANPIPLTPAATAGRYWGRRTFRPEGGVAVNREFNVLALLKGEEIYLYVYDDASRAALGDTFRAQAADPALGFSWFDAAVMARKADEQATQRPDPVSRL